MSNWSATHEFHLHDGAVIKVQAELRGDWVAFEQDGTSWYTVAGDKYLWWACSKRDVSSVKRVIKYGHRYKIESNGRSSRFTCECGIVGTWVRSGKRAVLVADDHHRDAMLDVP